MSLSKDEIVRLVEEHEAQCRRQPQERDWRGNPVESAAAEEPSAPASDMAAADEGTSSAGEGDAPANDDVAGGGAGDEPSFD